MPCRSKRHIACSDLFYKSERAHSAAPPFQSEPAALGFDLVSGTDLKVMASILFRCSTLRRRLWISHSGAKLWDAPVDNRGVPFFMFIFDRSGPHSEITLHHFCRWEERAGLTGRIFNALPDGEPALFAAA